MWRYPLAIVLLFGSLSASGDVGPPPEPTEEFFLPLVTKAIPVEVVVTARGEDIGYPTDYYVYGYVRNLTDKPLYSVVLEVDVTMYSYPGPLYDTKIQISPALSATLPNQSNPFAYSLTLGKAFASIGRVRAIDASFTEPNGNVYHPLTVVSWEYKDWTLSGTIRNDSSRTLENVRVVVAELTKCRWREAETAVRTLLPGQETTFSLSFSESWLGDGLLVVGQGAVQP